MKKLLAVSTAILLAFLTAGATQDNNTNSNASSLSTTKTAKTKAKRGPIFRASKEQVKQAQTILKQRGLYTGEPNGKLDAETRAGLKKYQAAEKLKITGTLNRLTLEKMNIALTDKQKVT